MHWLGALDWNRRLFDALIPLPDGTSYNAYLVQGSEKTALLDTVDPATTETLMAQLADISRLDLVISHHAEQDHSGALPAVLQKYPDARLLCTPKAKTMLMDLLAIAEDRIATVEDGQTLSLGDKTLKFIYTPWVHWPETMVTYLEEDRILFSCDFFGSHLATTDLYANEGRVYEPAKRYYAEIMMPFHGAIKGNLDKLQDYQIDLIAPSHGPLYRRPAFILDAYRDWVAAPPKNIVVLPYASMHGSTEAMVTHLIAALVEHGVAVEPFNLAVTDIGKLAMALVDAATIVVGTPTVMVHPHPLVVYAAYLANALRPKARYVTMIGSYGWGTKAAETLTGMLPNLKVEIIDPVICKGFPRDQDLAALDELARTIAAKHRENNFT
ncbi:MAG: FprA family A-type flavoprotein [Desulfobacteraceae bacterium]|nr:FprA family A-type flavoprotein [Desulfobacteraceae bacterium]